jgi:fatty acid desaturase
MTLAENFSVTKPKRDYSLVGQSTQWAAETGLASAKWYHSEIPRTTMKELIRRSDEIAIRDTILWLALIVGSAAGGIYFWGTWWCVPFFFVYGVLYGSSSDSLGMKAGTALRSRHVG